MRTLLISALLFLGGVLSPMSGQTTFLFDFSSLRSVDGEYGLSLHGSASLSEYAGLRILDLGAEGGWASFDASLADYLSGLSGDFTIATNVYLPAAEEGSDGVAAALPIWFFAPSEGKGSLVLDGSTPRIVLTSPDGTTEEIALQGAFEAGRWNSVILFRRSGRTSFYVNSQARSQKTTLSLSSIWGGGPTTGSRLYLGRGASEGSELAGAKFSNIRFCDFANTSLPALREETTRLNAYEDSVREARRLYEDSLALVNDMRAFTLGDVSALTDDITLPGIYKGRIRILWETSDPNVITADGHITRPRAGSGVAHATLTAYLSSGNVADTLAFEVGVLPEMSDAEAVALAMDQLARSLRLTGIYSDQALPTTGAEGTVVVWQSDDEAWLTSDGRLMRQPEPGEGSREVTLWATVMKNGERLRRAFTASLHEREPYTGYLFVYFPSNQNENIYYALSTDGYNYTPINEGQMVVSSDTISLKGGVRDPHILRAPDGLFYMVCTDMRSAQGWDSNRGLVMMKSADLIHWTHSRVNFPDRFHGTHFANVTRVWAPETIWDPDYENADGSRGRLMVYFSLLTNDNSIPYDKDYYCYANDDFTDLLDEPTFFYDRGSATIDMNIVYNERDSLYHGFYKNEGQGGICKVTARRLTAAPGEPAGSQWSTPSGTLQQTTEAVEGAGVFKRINSDEWVLMYDCYNNKHYQFCSSKDLERFTFVQNTETTGAFTPRHGTVIAITAEETRRLMEAFPTSELTVAVEGVGSRHAHQSDVVMQGTSIKIPVRRGVDLTSFDPELQVSVGSTVSPQGAQDFTQGAVEYVVANGVRSSTYRVTVTEEGNPVLSGFRADPEVLYSKKTGRFYIYPTTDGYDGWGGYTFDVFSSADLLNFTNEGTILDLQTSQVAWASGNAWAPCIEEKKVDGKWKYFFYFSGQNISLGVKTLGVAVAENPTGPFKASKSPLFTSTSGGQMIDSDVFTDPVTGQTYLYYGNGQMHYRLLSEDGLSVVGDEYTITPTGGTLADYAFREGTYVFYRGGLYYFLWSVDDTGSANYHVAYGTSTSPTGPIRVAKDPIVLIQDAAHEIYGTGHNSVVNIEGTDDWYIVYHRINRLHLNNGPGTHREVCVDRLTFDADGRIERVTPTREGIAGVERDVESELMGVETVEGDGDAVCGATYYTIDGKRLGAVAPSGRGLYIRQERTLGGGRRAVKIVK